MLNLSLLVVFALFVAVLVLYSRKVVAGVDTFLNRTENRFYRVFGKRIRRMNLRMSRASSLDKTSWAYKIDRYFSEIIVNLDMAKDNVTPFGLLFFISTVSALGGIVTGVYTGNWLMAVPVAMAFMYFVIVLFRFFSLIRFERREADIMDAQDLISMDVKGGVQNAISRYRNSFHPRIQPYFNQFLQDISDQNMTFEEAMRLLNHKLGASFSDFAQKAILYEKKADKDLDDIFSQVIEVNRHKRMLRYNNNKKFNELMLQFIISSAIIAGYGVFSVLTDGFIRKFLLNSTAGSILIIVDLVLIAWVLAYISTLKAKFL